MRYKNYNDDVCHGEFGVILESGLPTYTIMPHIKEVSIDGQWVSNPGYDLQKVKSQKLSEIESKILDASMKLDKANSLNLQTQVSELTAKLTELNKQKGEINAL